MSQVAISGNASGTGTLTIAAPNTNSNYTLTLPIGTGTFNISGVVNEVPAGTVSAPSIYPTGDTNTGIFFPAADTVGVSTGGSERMRVDSSGNVGIGTSSPATQLHVSGTNAVLNITRSTKNFYLNPNYANGGSYATFESDLALATVVNGAERMRIDSSGNLLVGTTANAITAYTASKSLVQSADYSGAVAQLINSTSTTGTQYFLAFGRGASVCGQITSGATNSTTYATSSDYRLKKDVQPMKGALAKVQALKPCTYKWIEDDTTSEGFIAHELAEVCPDAVVGEKDAVNAEGNPVYQGIDTSFLVATLTAAIQEQQALIQQLQADVAELKGATP